MFDVCCTDYITQSEDHWAEGYKEAQFEKGQENNRRYAGCMHRDLQTNKGWFQGQPQDSKERRWKGKNFKMATKITQKTKLN